MRQHHFLAVIQSRRWLDDVPGGTQPSLPSSPWTEPNGSRRLSLAGKEMDHFVVTLFSLTLIFMLLFQQQSEILSISQSCCMSRSGAACSCHRGVLSCSDAQTGFNVCDGSNEYFTFPLLFCSFCFSVFDRRWAEVCSGPQGPPGRCRLTVLRQRRRSQPALLSSWAAASQKRGHRSRITMKAVYRLQSK